MIQDHTHTQTPNECDKEKSMLQIKIDSLVDDLRHQYSLPENRRRIDVNDLADEIQTLYKKLNSL